MGQMGDIAAKAAAYDRLYEATRTRLSREVLDNLRFDAEYDADEGLSREERQKGQGLQLLLAMYDRLVEIDRG
jgi:hypothetical protein